MVKLWKIILAALVLTAAMKLAYFNINENNYYWDEAVYLDIAKNFQEHKTYLSTSGENYRAPLFPFLLAFLPNLKAAHLSVMLLSILSMLLAYLLGKEILNKQAGLMAALFIGINPLYYFWSYKLLTEPLTLCLILSSLYLFLRYEKTGNAKHLYLSFFMTGLATLSRYTSLSLVAALGLTLILKGKVASKKNIIASIILLATLTPLFFFGIKHYGNPIGMPLWNSIATSSPDMPLSSYTAGFFSFFTTPALLLFLFGLTTKTRKSIPNPLLFYLAFTIILLSAVNQKYMRFLIILLPAYSVIAGVGYAALSKKIGKLNPILLTLVIGLSALSVYNSVQAINSEKSNTEILLDAANFVKQSECTAVMTNSTKHFEHFGQKKTIDYPGSLEELKDITSTETKPCFVIDSFHGVSSYRNFINSTYTLIYANSSGHKFIDVYTP